MRYASFALAGLLLTPSLALARSGAGHKNVAIARRTEHETSNFYSGGSESEAPAKHEEMKGEMSEMAMTEEPKKAKKEMAHTTTSAKAHATSAVSYGSGSKYAAQTYDSCVQQCSAMYGGGLKSGGSGEAPPPPSSKGSEGSPPAVGGEEAAPLVAGPGEIVVAPKKGDLRFVPFAMEVPSGSSVLYKWGAGPHTVTKSSAILPCNASLDAGAFKSGQQNATFEFTVNVTDASQPTFYYCAVLQHCKKGMFGILNPTKSSVETETFSSHIGKLESSDSEFAALKKETDTMCADNMGAKNWGSSFALSNIPEESYSAAMYSVLYTRQFYSQNPSVLIANTPGSSSSSSLSGASDPSVGAVPTGDTASAADASASALADQKKGLEGAASSVSFSVALGAVTALIMMRALV